MPRGRSWAQEEVSRLLALVGGSKEVVLLMSSSESVWQEISRELAAAGYHRTAAQCRSKWKALKQAFYSEWETRQKDGCNLPSLSPYYEAMESIWIAGGRPVFVEQRVQGVVKLPCRKRRAAPDDDSSPPPKFPEHNDPEDTLDVPSVLQSVQDRPANSSSGDHVAGVSPAPLAMPHTSRCCSPLPLQDECCTQAGSTLLPGSHTSPEQERAQETPDVPGEMSLGMGNGNQMRPVAATAQSSHRTAAANKHPAGSSESGSLQSIHHLLKQILESSRQQQVLLESLASNTTSYLQFTSRRLAQMGQTLHQVLLQPPNLCDNCVLSMSISEGASEDTSSSGTPHTSLDDNQDPQTSHATGCNPECHHPQP